MSLGSEGSEQLEDWKLLLGAGMQSVCTECPKYISGCLLALQVFCRREQGSYHARVHSLERLVCAKGHGGISVSLCSRIV